MPDLHYVCVCMTISQIPQKLLVTQSPGCGLLAKLRPLGPPPPAPLCTVPPCPSLQSFAHEFLSCCHLECLLVGNITASEAQAMAASLRTTLNQSSSSSHGSTVQLVSAADRRQEQCVVLPAGVALLHKASARNPQEENCCVEAYIQVM